MGWGYKGPNQDLKKNSYKINITVKKYFYNINHVFKINIIKIHIFTVNIIVIEISQNPWLKINK